MNTPQQPRIFCFTDDSGAREDLSIIHERILVVSSGPAPAGVPVDATDGDDWSTVRDWSAPAGAGPDWWTANADRIATMSEG